MALSVPLSRFAPRVGGGSAFFVRPLDHTKFMFNLFKKKPKPDESFNEPLSPEADKFLADALAEYQAKREALLTGEWRLRSCADWGFDPESGTVTVVFPDRSQWQASAQFLGSYAVKEQSWQWAWDSPDMGEQLSRDSRLVKDLGERLGIRYLQLGGGSFGLPGPEFSEYLCAIGVKATDSVGIMEADAGPMVGFIMLKDLRWTNAVA